MGVVILGKTTDPCCSCGYCCATPPGMPAAVAKAAGRIVCLPPTVLHMDQLSSPSRCPGPGLGLLHWLCLVTRQCGFSS